MRKPTFSITTLGCKLNQFESECIRQKLISRDWEYIPFGHEADFYIINTCTVTGKTDSRCRNAIRRARKISPECTIVVTGCYAETQPEILRDMTETDLVIGNSGKKSLTGILDGLAGRNVPEETAESVDIFQIDRFSDHSRAFIKVQEGCDASCTYCIIPRARGRSRSVPAAFVLEQVERLAMNGVEEIVLTGIHVGRYGNDLGGGLSLERLVRLILENTARMRIRLSSIEVNEVTDGLLSIMSETGRLAPHLHIPLQSGDDLILGAMNRPYDTRFFRSRIESVRAISGSIGIGTDIITGFPGEDEDSFGKTYRFVESLPLTYFHVFPFSRRPGTPADSMQAQVDAESKKRRSRRLIDLGRHKKRIFMKSRTGTVEPAIIQGKAKRYSRFSTALTGNYCEVNVECPDSLVGRLKMVDISHYSRGRLYGRVTEVPAAGGGSARE